VDRSIDFRSVETPARNPAEYSFLSDAARLDGANGQVPPSNGRTLDLADARTARHNDFDFVMQQVLADDCQIYVVQTGLYEGANLRALAAERRMEQLAAQTGGAAYIPKTTSALESAFKEIAADLAQQYILSYYHAQEIRDGRFHLIDLRIKSRKDVRVRARKGYYSPKGTSVANRNQ